MLAAYLVFRHADRAKSRGDLTAEDASRLNVALRTRVGSVWERLYPDRSAGAYAWIVARIALLEAEGVLPGAAKARLQEVASSRSVGSPPWNDPGALPSLFRIHVLYLLVVELESEGALPPGAATRVTEALHLLALTAIGREVRAAPAGAVHAAQGLVEAARSLVAELERSGQLSSESARVISASLAGGMQAVGKVRVDSSGDSVICQVCGEAPGKASVVLCAQCETPHHAECWRFIGKCSTFACGCLDAIPSGGPIPARGASRRYDLVHPADLPYLPPCPPQPRQEVPAGQVITLIGLVVTFLALLMR